MRQIEGPLVAFNDPYNHSVERRRAFTELCKHTLQHKEYPKKTMDNYLKRPLCAIDIETRGLGGEFLVGEADTSDGENFVAYSLEDLFNWMLQHPQYLYLSHNASGYEFCYFYEWIYGLFENNENAAIDTVSQNGGRIIAFIIRNKETKELLLEWRDTYCLFNTKLSKVADAYTPDMPKGEPPWNKAHDNFEVDNPIWMDYLHRDCRILWRAYREFQKQVYELFGSPIGITAGSTAMRAFKKSIDYVRDEDGNISYRETIKKHKTKKGELKEYRTKAKRSKMYFRVGEEQENFFRQAYYGAIVNPGHQIGDWGETASVDVNGAYAYQMVTHKYPVGRGVWTTCYEGPDVTGIYNVIAHVPVSLYNELGFNPVPMRTKTGLRWPSGTFETFITHTELAYAMEKGCTFDIIEGYVWWRLEDVFKNFIEKCQLLELENAGKFKETVKLMRNSLYGYFGTKPEHEVFIFLKDDEPIPQDEEIYPLIDQDKPGFTIVDKMVPGVFVKTEKLDTDYMMVHWAAFTTAWQRVYMMRFMEECYQRGAKNVYVDTDSLKTDPEVLASMIADGTLRTGIKYGEFKLEDIFEKFIVVGPKGYYGVTNKSKHVSKCKGIPSDLRTEQLFDEAVNNRRKQRSFESTRSLRDIIRSVGNGTRSIRVGTRRKRSITNLENSSAWEVKDNRIYPKGWLELAANTS